MDSQEDMMEKLHKASIVFQEAMQEIEEEEETWWNNLSKEDQLKALCCVSRRICQGELVEKRSYRGMLYDVFGFDGDAYARAQCAGYLAIHNSIDIGEDDYNGGKDNEER